MAMQQTIGSCSSSLASEKFDVFISFRGEDTRNKFTSHLYEALRKRVTTFIDDSELKKGDEISSALIKAIEGSCASIVIFSKDYASSKWCLNELVKILECKKDHGQIVIPIFYKIEPSHVRNQIGTYGQSLAKHEQDPKHTKVELKKWKDALTEAATLSGWDSKNYRIESEFIKVIVKDVLKQLKHGHPIEVNKEVVGIEKRYEEVISLVKMGLNDVKTLGLWGMGGIGKTTLAKDLYAKLCSQFEHHCFIENVRDESTRCGLRGVRNKLFSMLLELGLDEPCPETPTAQKRLKHAKCFIVLDDVATLDQAENLKIGLGPGSRVIITTRNKETCSEFDECKIYEVKELNEYESLQLFCSNAFREKHAKVGYEELSKSAIGYCRGNPLALKVLGGNLRTKSKEGWESELKKIKEIPDRRIHDVLKLSFVDLDLAQQDIFLDIICFFNLDYTSTFERDYLTTLWNACNFFAATEIEVLLHKALVTFNKFGKIEMHDLLKEMGREIIKQGSPKDFGRRSRLWDPKEVHHVFKHNIGTEFVEVIMFDTTDIKEDLYLSSNFFRSMINLRALHITHNRFRVHLRDGLEWLSDNLRHLYWDTFPLESLPSSTFCAQNLVQLSMRYSKLKKLWDGIQELDNLTIINLDNSEDLIEIPDLSRAPNLKRLSLKHCVSLGQLHPSIFSAPKLRELHLWGCKKIESLKTNIHSKSLQKLNLTYCSSLVEFSVTSEEMTNLSLGDTAIHELPSSIWGNRKLVDLDLSGCEKLVFVWKQLSYVTGFGSLIKLCLSGCSQINALNMWFLLDGARSLKELNLRGCCNLETLPDNIENCLMLETLYLDECIFAKLKSLPKLPASLQNLIAMCCTNSIQREMLENMLHVPKIVEEKLSNDPGMGSLTLLNLSGCKQINTLNMQFLLHGARSLKKLYLNECCNLETLPDNIQNCSMLEILDLSYCCNLEALPDNIQNCSMLKTLCLDECRNLISLPIPNLPASLQELSAINCTYLVTNFIQREMLRNMLIRLNNNNYKRRPELISILPGAQVPCKFDLYTTGASIVIPKHGLCYFVFCIILPEKLELLWNIIRCTIYEHGKEVYQWDISVGIGDGFLEEILISDHVLQICWSDIDKLENGSGGDHYNLSFKFESTFILSDDDRIVEKKVWSTKGIKGCGIIPGYIPR